VSGVQQLIIKAEVKNNLFGIITNDDIETYATIVALLLLGKCFVPIDSKHPNDRNFHIIGQTELSCIYCSDKSYLSDEFLSKQSSLLVFTKNLPSSSKGLVHNNYSEEDLAYILFTSGTTGFPKGVPITYKNLNSFINAFLSYGYDFNSSDRFLQIFDLTFDLSIYSYLFPLIIGASIYTIPKNEIRYSFAYTLLEDHQITCALTVPSFVNFLKPYFEEIDLPDVKYWLFCGEALQKDIIGDWKKCIPKGKILNVYGPTEATIFCTNYECFGLPDMDKDYNGIVCIGKPMPGVDVLIVGEELQEVVLGATGELCLSGEQTTKGYVKNPERNKTSFFTIEKDGKDKTYYRTGDLCFIDKDGDLMYTGRLDSQVKVQGFRVELSEIENHARSLNFVSDAVAVAVSDNQSNTLIHLFVTPVLENKNEEILRHLRSKIPEYMVPKEVHSIKSFPLNVNGKTDRKELSKLLGKK
jgi:amino acid adenylation domain-containing protein